MSDFNTVVGVVLRRTREERGLTLRDVELRSHGYFKPSVVGGYERGERSISLDRFSRLAEIYDAPADRLLSLVLEELHPEGRSQVVIDLVQLEKMGGPDAERLNHFVSEIKEKRGDTGATVVTLRSGDLQELALRARVRPYTLATRVSKALKRPQDP